MTRRSNRSVDAPGMQGIRSPDLVRLDRDLREIVIEERSSFGAELLAVLGAEQARLRSEAPRSGWLRPARLAAAAVVLLFAGALLVPVARASLVRLLRPTGPAGPVTAQQLAPTNPPGNPTVPVVAGRASVPREAETSDIVPVPQPEPGGTGVQDARLPLSPTLPSLRDREQARRAVTEEYPVALQSAGVGGAVRVVLWVRPDGTPETPKVRASSGVAGLDQAALRAAGSIQFVPATRSGQPVGTWVEFSVRFVPNATGSQPDPEYRAFELPPIN